LLSLLPWCSVSNPPLSLVSFRTPYSWDILRGRSIVTRDTCSKNIEVPTKYPLSQDRIAVFEISLHNKSLMLYRLALHGNWNALSLARRALMAHTNGSTHSCFAKSSGISAGPCISSQAFAAHDPHIDGFFILLLCGIISMLRRFRRKRCFHVQGDKIGMDAELFVWK
jgi:hypothetical protein